MKIKRTIRRLRKKMIQDKVFASLTGEKFNKELSEELTIDISEGK